jgi:hypothetical protein
MSDTPISDVQGTQELLGALGEQLAARGESYTLAVVGGSALIALGLISRATRDVDVLALVEGQELVSAEPLPPGLLDAARTVARDFGLAEDWLNPGPSSLLQLGLPRGFYHRAERRVYGEGLEVLFASRLDQIHLKLYATVDQGAGKHLSDLQALAPTRQELLDAAAWSETHDPSEGYRGVLSQVLAHLGVDDGPAAA